VYGSAQTGLERNRRFKARFKKQEPLCAKAYTQPHAVDVEYADGNGHTGRG